LIDYLIDYLINYLFDDLFDYLFDYLMIFDPSPSHGHYRANNSLATAALCQ
jgi:hypothetical protein